MAYAGQGERLHVISEVCVYVCVNRIDTVDCAKLLEGSLLWTLVWWVFFFFFIIIVGSCHLNFNNFHRNY